MRKCLFLILVLLLVKPASSQVVPYHISNKGVYEFLEELASLKIFLLNNAVIPLSRKHIFSLLKEAQTDSVSLNPRQLKELQFYLQEFIKEDPEYRRLDYLGKGLRAGKVFPLRNRKKRYDLFFYKDSVFSITLNPIVGGRGYFNTKRFNYHRKVGVRFYGNVTEYLSFYGELRDHSESTPLSDELFLNQNLGANYKRNNEFSEMRGGITASYKWASLGLVKDHIQWGSAYNGSNIFSGRTPSFPMIKFNLSPVKWFSFDYVHAWLVSDVIDSTASYTAGSVDREIMRSKFLAANIFTVMPLNGLHISLGNSVVYADKFNPVYLIPFLFYKSVDHTLNSTGAGNNYRGQNSQMFLNIVSRQIRHLQIYTSLFVDEIKLSTMTDPKNSRNHFSWKIGGRFTSPGNINLTAVFEYTHTNPIAYRHFISTTTFESNSYQLGHYLGDNAQEYFGSLIYKPISRLHLNLSFGFVRKGTNYEYQNGSDGSGLPFILEEKIKRYDTRVGLSYTIAHDVSVAVRYQYLLETGPEAYTRLPKPYKGELHHLSLSLRIGY